MKIIVDTEGMNSIMKSIDKFTKGIQPEEVEKRTQAIKKVAKLMCSNNITFKQGKGRQMYVILKDRNTANCLTKAIESCLPLMSLFLQGVFTKFVSEIRDAKFNS